MSQSKSLTLEALNPGNELQSLYSCRSILNFPQSQGSWKWEESVRRHEPLLPSLLGT